MFWEFYSILVLLVEYVSCFQLPIDYQAPFSLSPAFFLIDTHIILSRVLRVLRFSTETFTVNHIKRIQGVLQKQ